MRINHIGEKLMYVSAVGIGIFLLFFVICCTWIGYEVKSQCQEAKREYSGECVSALIHVLNDENKDFRTRNDAIWALGQLGDSRAYPILKKYYTGNIPQREPLNTMISQYELRKAVNLTSGGVNITAFIWRSIL